MLVVVGRVTEVIMLVVGNVDPKTISCASKDNDAKYKLFIY